MPFRTLFGLGHLLREYGVESQGLRLDDTEGTAFSARAVPGSDT